MGGEGSYIPIATPSPVIPALRWTAMRAILMFQQEVFDKVTGQCPQTTTFLKRKESRSGIEPRSFRFTNLTAALPARPNWLIDDGLNSRLLFPSPPASGQSRRVRSPFADRVRLRR